MPQDKKNLLVKPVSPTAVSRGTLTVTPESTGYRYLTLSICKLSREQRFQSNTGAAELGLGNLGRTLFSGVNGWVLV